MPDSPDLFSRTAARLDAVLDTALPAGTDRTGVAVEPPRDPTHGDMAINAAMVLAKRVGARPRDLATEIAMGLGRLPEVDQAEVAGPGFINLRLKPAVWHAELEHIRAAGADYGRSNLGAGKRANVEYVSANPTGPMHMGHCRGAVVGDALATLLAFTGHQVTREYYINDAGAQVDTLARSVHLRYREALGEQVTIPEGLYPGDYLVPIGQGLATEYGPRYASTAESDWLVLFRTRAVAAMMKLIRADLALLGIHHDVFASEAHVQASGKVDAALADLRARDLIYDGSLPPPKGQIPPEGWAPGVMPLFRSTQFGDDEDRPVRKADGGLTYFGTDLAYHAQKAAVADMLIDIWGADHAGTVKRIVAAVQALTGGRVPLDIKLVQMVRLLRAGEPVKMSKRAGNFVTLAEVVDEVGKDVVRFAMLTRRADAQMDFDFATVVEQSRDNPVFYVQYAHARIRSLERRAADAGLDLPADADVTLLDADELNVIKLLAAWPRAVEAAAVAREPHRIATYLNDVAAAFHGTWNRGNDDPAKRFVVADAALTAARLALADGVRVVLTSGLALMGVEPADELR